MIHFPSHPPCGGMLVGLTQQRVEKVGCALTLHPSGPPYVHICDWKHMHMQTPSPVCCGRACVPAWMCVCSAHISPLLDCKDSFACLCLQCMQVAFARARVCVYVCVFKCMHTLVQQPVSRLHVSVCLCVPM